MPSCGHRFIATVAVALVAASVSAGHADDVPFPLPPTCRVLTPENEAAARALATYWFEQGVAQVAREAFADAALSFACAHAILPHPATLYNLGRAAEWAGDLPTAVRALRMYRDGLRHGPERAEIDAKLQSLEDEMQNANATETERLAAEQPGTTDHLAAEQPAMPGDEPRPASRALIVAGWTSVGGAAVGLIVGSVFAALVADQWNRIEETPQGTPWLRVAKEKEKLESYQWGTGIGFGVAGVAALVGTFLLVLGDDESDEVVVAPVVDEGATGLTLTWRF